MNKLFFDQVLNNPGKWIVKGNSVIARNKTLAFFCSAQCPAKLIIKAHDFSKQLAAQGATVISGFHSPVEQEALIMLLRGKQPIIIFPARTIKNYSIPAGWKQAYDSGRLLLISPLKNKRATQEFGIKRNKLVAQLADAIFVAHAAPNSKTEFLCKEFTKLNKPLFTFSNAENRNLHIMGFIDIWANM